jgi:hypothetical protein
MRPAAVVAVPHDPLFRIFFAPSRLRAKTFFGRLSFSSRIAFIRNAAIPPG